MYKLENIFEPNLNNLFLNHWYILVVIFIEILNHEILPIILKGKVMWLVNIFLWSSVYIRHDENTAEIKLSMTKWFQCTRDL